MRTWKVNLVVLAAVVCCMTGCGGGSETLLTGDVTGTITLGGRPLADADVYFMSQTGGFVGFGKTDADGRYRLVQGAAPGANTSGTSDSVPQLGRSHRASTRRRPSSRDHTAFAVWRGRASPFTRTTNGSTSCDSLQPLRSISASASARAWRQSIPPIHELRIPV